jgi:hypothetical protein
MPRNSSSGRAECPIVKNSVGGALEELAFFRGRDAGVLRPMMHLWSRETAPDA